MVTRPSLSSSCSSHPGSISTQQEGIQRSAMAKEPSGAARSRIQRAVNAANSAGTGRAGRTGGAVQPVRLLAHRKFLGAKLPRQRRVALRRRNVAAAAAGCACAAESEALLCCKGKRGGGAHKGGCTAVSLGGLGAAEERIPATSRRRRQDGRVLAASGEVAAAGGGGGRRVTHQPSTMQRSRSRSHRRSFVSWKQTTSAGRGGALQESNSLSGQAAGSSQRHPHRHLTAPDYLPAPRISNSCERVTPSRFKHARRQFTLNDSSLTLSWGMGAARFATGKRQRLQGALCTWFAFWAALSWRQCWRRSGHGLRLCPGLASHCNSLSLSLYLSPSRPNRTLPCVAGRFTGLCKAAGERGAKGSRGRAPAPGTTAGERPLGWSATAWSASTAPLPLSADRQERQTGNHGKRGERVAAWAHQP